MLPYTVSHAARLYTLRVWFGFQSYGTPRTASEDLKTTAELVRRYILVVHRAWKKGQGAQGVTRLQEFKAYRDHEGTEEIKFISEQRRI